MLLIKNSDAVNEYSMEEVIRYLNDFTVIRNKKNNAKLISISVKDNKGDKHTIKITSEGNEVNSFLAYQYESKVNNVCPELFYLNANRVGVQEWSSISDRRVGIAGEYLFSIFEQVKVNTVPDYLIKDNTSKTIAYQFKYWLTFISGVSSELDTEKSTDRVKVSFKINNLEGNVSPFNLGAGMSYLAKVLIICLIAKKGDIILIENPEIHLHPKAQSLLAVFLSFIASKGIQLIVETHCEHLINKLAFEVFDDQIKSKDVIIHYKENENEPFVSLGINDDGEFIDLDNKITGFPSGFFDATLNDLLAMR